MKKIFAPGCALMLYELDLADKTRKVIESIIEEQLPIHNICCRHQTELTGSTNILTICTSCRVRYRQQRDDFTITTIWKILAESNNFLFPDYAGMEMSIQDGCLVRGDATLHNAIRTLLVKMNIKIIEAERSGANSICCGDSFYGSIPVLQIKQQMINRANQMPCNDVAVYCVSCLNAMHIGGKRPRYILDLLFGEETEPQIYDLDEWHNQLNTYIGSSKRQELI